MMKWKGFIIYSSRPPLLRISLPLICCRSNDAKQYDERTDNLSPLIQLESTDISKLTILGE